MAAVLPTMMVVFFCQTVPGHSGMVGPPNWVDLDWATNAEGLHICKREYRFVKDMTADWAKKVLHDPALAPAMHPDISKPETCSYIGAFIEDGDDAPWYARERGCPDPIRNDKGEITDYTDPPCPPGDLCVNESVNL